MGVWEPVKDKNGNPVIDQATGLVKMTLIHINTRGKTIKQNLGPLDNNHRKSLIYEWLGVADHFKGGAMYYAAPIENVKGDIYKNYGVVRNTFYQFILNDITQLGTSVDNPEEAIVPNTVTKGIQLNFDINILGWDVFEATVPDLSVN